MASILTISFCSCKEKIDLNTGVTYRTYTMGEGSGVESYASFYMTSNKETEGVWEYTIEGDDAIKIIESNETNKEMKGGIANYKTLVVKATSQGFVDITFKLGDRKTVYSLVIDKTVDEVLEMNVFEVE